mmetsp:Transcript_69884/g.227480  ORF Transcript_69884/g.227480 Transcript_69884/m.227480 type:complete len:254 (-) Transcript_69884:1689-2450(-)
MWQRPSTSALERLRRKGVVRLLLPGNPGTKLGIRVCALQTHGLLRVLAGFARQSSPCARPEHCVRCIMVDPPQEHLHTWLRAFVPEGVVVQCSAGKARASFYGAVEGDPEVVERLKKLASAVKTVMFSRVASASNTQAFLNAVETARDADRGAFDDAEVKLCSNCARPANSDRLNGRHMCRMVATLRCSRCGHAWTTQRARWDLMESRMMENYCEPCRGRCSGLVAGKVVKSELLSAEALQLVQKRRGSPATR